MNGKSTAGSRGLSSLPLRSTSKERDPWFCLGKRYGLRFWASPWQRCSKHLFNWTGLCSTLTQWYPPRWIRLIVDCLVQIIPWITHSQVRIGETAQPIGSLKMRRNETRAFGRVPNVRYIGKYSWHRRTAGRLCVPTPEKYKLSARPRLKDFCGRTRGREIAYRWFHHWHFRY